MQTKESALERQDISIAEAITRDGPRLRRFVRSRVFDSADVEDIVQDVFYELIEAYRLLKPAEQVTAWLFRVARNRITDLFRRRRDVSLDEHASDDESADSLGDLLPSPDAGPDALFARKVLLEALEEALDELPQSQREVFLAHEIDGRSFKELSDETGTSVNTLLSRKRYAVLYLRDRLKRMEEPYDED